MQDVGGVGASVHNVQFGENACQGRKGFSEGGGSRMQAAEQAAEGAGAVGWGAPMVRSPSGSTCRAICSASELERSELAAVTARMMAVGAAMNSCTMRRTRSSMSAGWSPTGTRVMPGRSTSVIVLPAATTTGPDQLAPITHSKPAR